MTNTVHVHDLCRAICFVLHREDTCGQVFNVVDDGCTTQGILNDLISQLFDVNTSYVENIISPLYKVSLLSSLQSGKRNIAQYIVVFNIFYLRLCNSYYVF